MNALHVQRFFNYNNQSKITSLQKVSSLGLLFLHFGSQSTQDERPANRSSRFFTHFLSAPLQGTTQQAFSPRLALLSPLASFVSSMMSFYFSTGSPSWHWRDRLFSMSPLWLDIFQISFAQNGHGHCPTLCRPFSSTTDQPPTPPMVARIGDNWFHQTSANIWNNPFRQEQKFWRKQTG